MVYLYPHSAFNWAIRGLPAHNEPVMHTLMLTLDTGTGVGLTGLYCNLMNEWMNEWMDGWAIPKNRVLKIVRTWLPYRLRFVPSLPTRRRKGKGGILSKDHGNDIMLQDWYNFTFVFSDFSALAHENCSLLASNRVPYKWQDNLSYIVSSIKKKLLFTSAFFLFNSNACARRSFSAGLEYVDFGTLGII